MTIKYSVKYSVKWFAKQFVLITAFIFCLNQYIGPSFAGGKDAGPESYLAWFKPVNAHLRTAISYLRTGNTDFAALALEDLIAAKTQEVTGSVTNQALLKIVQSTPAEAKSALDLIDANQPEKARAALLKMRQSFFAGHQKNNITVFDDCIWALVKKGPPLWYYRKNRPDLGNREQLQSVAKAAANYLQQLNTCDSQATPQLKADGDYHRIVNGARQSLERIPVEALAQKDSGQLYRFIIELRSFDRLLYFRFG